MANFRVMLNNNNLTVNVFASIDFSYIRRYARKIKKTPERYLAYVFMISLCGLFHDFANGIFFSNNILQLREILRTGETEMVHEFRTGGIE